MSRYPSALQPSGNWLYLLLLAGIAGYGLGFPENDIPPPARQMLLAAGATLSGYLLLGLADSRQPPRVLPLLRWCLLTALAAFLLMLPGAVTPSGLPGAILVSLGAAVVLLLLGSLLLLALALLQDEAAALLLVTLLAAACCCAPLWLGPLVLRASANQSLVDAVVAASPASYLAVLADYDYLRGDWFYRHAPFGGLRYDYPSAGTVTIVYLALSATSLALQRRLRELGLRAGAGLHHHSA